MDTGPSEVEPGRSLRGEELDRRLLDGLQVALGQTLASGGAGV
jgi:hypothetical protein